MTLNKSDMVSLLVHQEQSEKTKTEQTNKGHKKNEKKVTLKSCGLIGMDRDTN